MKTMHVVTPDKNKDQHILVDARILKKVVDAGELSKADVVLEVGGGPGNLTELLAKEAKMVNVVERDGDYSAKLRGMFKGSPNVNVIEGDILDVKLPEFNKIVCNPPYQILQQLFYRLVREGRQDFQVCVMTLPHKFTKLATAQPTDPDFGVISALFCAFYDVQVLEEVPKEAFDPMPRVTSHIVKITPKLSGATALQFILKSAFLRPEKKLGNAIIGALWDDGYEALGKKFTKKEAKEIISALEEFSLTNILDKKVFQLSNLEIGKFCKSVVELQKNSASQDLFKQTK